MVERILFLTGRLAYDSLCREIEQLAQRTFTYEVLDLGLTVAALMTADMIRRRLPHAHQADRIIVPGLCGGRVEELSAHYGVPVIKGPKDLKDLPEFFGQRGRPPDLSRHNVLIFAEIVNAPLLTLDELLTRANHLRAEGADVIDLGCLPGTAFPHLRMAVQTLKAAGFLVSIDSVATDDLLCGGQAGADYLLSLKESTLWLTDAVASVPVLIPEQAGDMDSLYRAAAYLAARGRTYYADPILDPIHFGFTESIVRYHALRQRLPDAPILMGVSNLTELTDADTTGTNALLFGIISELDIQAVLTTAVSPHARNAVREADAARRLMYAAKQDRRLPRSYSNALLSLRDRKPFPRTAAEIATTAQAIKDPSFRVQVSAEGVHIYNRTGLHTATDPFALYPHLDVAQDGGHAFYLGVELARAQIAWQLGKRYLQDHELSWGCAVTEASNGPETDGYPAAGSTTLKKDHTP